MKWMIILPFACCLSASPLAAQHSLYWDLPTTPGNISLGTAALAVCAEPEGLAINPAGLADVKWRTARASGLQWWQDVFAGSFSGAMPMKPLGTASLSLGYWSFGSMSALGPQGQHLGNIESQAVLWGLGWGRPLFYGLSAGLSFKGYSLLMPERKDWGWGADAGVLYGYRFLTATVVIRNLGPKYPVNNSIRFEMPSSANLGLGAKFLGEKLSAGAVLTSARYRKPVLSAGLEVRPVPYAGARLGYDNDRDKPERSPVGLGLSLHTTGAQDYSVEYGYRSYGALGEAHSVSIGMSF